MSDHYLKQELYQLIRKDNTIFDFLQAGSLDGIWYWDIEKPENEWMSERFWEVLGYDPSLMPHSPDAWQDLINQEDLKVALDNFHRHCEDPDHPYDQVVRFRHADGSTVWIRCRGIAIRDKSGKPTRMLGAHSDITESMQQKAALKSALEESKERFQLAAEGASVGIWDWPDVEKDERWWSPRFYTLIGYELGEIVPSMEGLKYLVHPDDWKGFEGAFAETLENGTPFGVEYRLRTKDRGYRWFQGQATLVKNATGKVTRMVGSIQDVHDRREAEEELRRANARLQAVNQDLREFAYVTSHDLREPLRSISSFLQLLYQDYGGCLDEEALGYIRFARSGSLRLQSMIDGLLSYSRIDRAGSKQEAFDLFSSARQSVSELSKLIQENEAVVEFLGESPTVFGNVDQITQLFQNLIVNALKFRSEESPVVHIRSASLDCSHDGGARYLGNQSFCKIEVKDNGIGIDPEYHESIFKIFERLYPEKNHEGDGIGLALCNRIVRRHGGVMGVRSKEGEGSVFYFTLPLAVGI
ncbi:sensor histidine kinase [Pelagicoccus albus]|uniref:histidine kinase n=1 Tax=Pelagicoccus albus TaxID=415222 RepID=A0A7X1E8R0_9BACT|nr:PAS domain-containing protein [Pelagicoccus albus]MBC2606619.1 PAS domain-containing protein [Pelagicoccus albus]